MTGGSNSRPRAWETDVYSTRPQPWSLEMRSCVRCRSHACFFSCPFFNSFCLFSFICFALFYLQWRHYLFKGNYFPLHDTQPNRTIFSFSNSRTLVNQLLYHWSCAMASFWDFKIICAPSIISKTVQYGSKFDSFLIKRCFLFCFVHVVLLISLEIMRKKFYQ